MLCQDIQALMENLREPWEDRRQEQDRSRDTQQTWKGKKQTYYAYLTVEVCSFTRVPTFCSSPRYQNYLDPFFFIQIQIPLSPSRWGGGGGGMDPSIGEWVQWNPALQTSVHNGPFRFPRQKDRPPCFMDTGYLCIVYLFCDNRATCRHFTQLIWWQIIMPSLKLCWYNCCIHSLQQFEN